MKVADHAGLSDIGAVRPNNEDRWHADLERGLFIVADGLGGHAAGEVAAQRVVDGLPKLLASRIEGLAGQPDTRVARTFKAAMRALNRAVWNEGQSIAEYRGMGATVVLALVYPDAALFANVGDCRAYLFRDHQLHQLTHDHSFAQHLLDQGLLSADDPRMALARQQLLQHIGIPQRPMPSMCKVSLAQGDRILLCSDGLTDMLDPEEISDVLRSVPDARSACASLVREANLAGGRDNVTVVVMNIGD